jgi:hypothetical protein
MPGLDALPADQRAVLQLVLRQGRSYDEIARALRIEPAAVRARAHDGLAALAAPGELNGKGRAGVADWLLGQQDAGERERTEELLARDGAARRWAGELAGELRDVATARELPALPPEREPGSVPEREGAAPAPRIPAATARPSSRRGGAVLLAAVALFAAIILVIVLTRGGDKAPQRATSTGTSSTSTAASQNRVLRQVNLKPPSGAPAPSALGVAQVSLVNGKQVLYAIAQGLKVSKTTAWAVWVQSGSETPIWVGPFAEADKQGRIYATGTVRSGVDITRYARMIVTREKPGKKPGTPGPVYLSGPITPSQGG